MFRTRSLPPLLLALTVLCNANASSPHPPVKRLLIEWSSGPAGARLDRAYRTDLKGLDGTTASTELATAIVSRTEVSVRKYAVSMIGELPSISDRAVSVLIDLLRTDDEKEVKAHAVVALAKIGKRVVPEVLSTLTRVITEHHEGDNVDAAAYLTLVLAEIGDQAIPPLLAAHRTAQANGSPQSAKQQPNAHHLDDAVLFVFSRNGARALPFILPLLSSEDEAETLLGLKALGGVEAWSRAASDGAIALLQSNNPKIRHAAVDASLHVQSPPAPLLLQAARSTDPYLRLTACSRLTQRDVRTLGPEAQRKVVSTLCTLASDANMDVKIAALTALQTYELSDPANIKSLQDGLADTDPVVRKESLQALLSATSISDLSPGFTQRLGRCFSEGSAETQADVVRIAGVIGVEDQEISRLLYTASKSANPTIQEAAAKAIANIPTVERYFMLLEMALVVTDPSARITIADSLNNIARRLPATITDLISHLHAPDEALRETAAASLGDAGAEAQSAAPILLQIIRNDTQRCATAAVGSLIQMHPVGRRYLFAAVTSRNDPILADRALSALGEIIDTREELVISSRVFSQDEEGGTFESLPVLQRLLIHASLERKQRITRIIGTLGARGTPLLFTILQTAAPAEFREAVLEQIATVKERDAKYFPILLRSLADKSPLVSSAAAQCSVNLRLSKAKYAVLSRSFSRVLRGYLSNDHSDSESILRVLNAIKVLGPRASNCVPQLIALCDNDEVCEAAIAALGAVGRESRSAASELVRHLTDEDPQIRIAAARALAESGVSPDSLPRRFQTVLNDAAVESRVDRLLSYFGSDADPGNEESHKVSGDITASEPTPTSASQVTQSGNSTYGGNSYTPRGVDPAQLQGFPKNLARQHLGANLFQYDASTSAYSPTAASAAWLDDDISTGYAMLSGKQHYLLAFPQAELISNFELSAKQANGTISLYAGDEPAAPTAKSWSLLAKDIPFEAINEKRLGQTFARTAKYILIETNISDPGPVYSLYVYGNRPAVAYEIRNREQAIDTKSIFGPYTNDATAFNVTSLYGKTFVRSQDGALILDLQKAIDDNPETFITLGGGQASAVELRAPQSQQISRVAVEVNPGAKGRLDFFLSNDDGTEAAAPAATIMLDGSSSRANVDFLGTNASVIRARWTAANGADAVKLHELNAFGSKSLAINTVTSGPDLIAERDGSIATREARNGCEHILPELRWPSYYHLAQFGREVPRSFLGSASSTLLDVSRRLYSAILAADENFEGRLFGVEEGFAVVCRMERIKSDGTPLSGLNHFSTTDTFPFSVVEYLQRLFLEPPGYYRVIAFVITKESDLRLATSASLEGIAEEVGGAELPEEIQVVRLGACNAFVLVYTFEKKRGGVARIAQLPLSVKTHLMKAGIWNSLARISDDIPRSLVAPAH